MKNPFRPAKDAETFKHIESAAIAADLATWQAKGGVIEKLGPEARGQPILTTTQKQKKKRQAPIDYRTKARRAKDEEE